jgi:hypothetical protein
MKYEPAQGVQRIDPYRQYAGFIQDSWKISNHFGLNIGLRYNIVDADTKGEGVEEKLSILDWNTLEPRIALGLDPFGDGKTNIKIGYAKYSHMMWTWFYDLNPNQQKQIQYYISSPGVFSAIWESEPYAFEVDPDFKRPYVNEWLFSIERALSSDLSLKFSYIDRNNKDIVTVTDISRTEDWYVPVPITNPITGKAMTVYDLKDDAPLDSLDYYSNDPRAQNHYRGLLFEFQKKLSHNYQFRLSWNYSFTKANNASNGAQSSSMIGVGYFSDMNWAARNFGLATWTSHVIKFQGIWYAPLGIVMSVNYLGQSGYQYENYFSYSLPNYGVTYVAAEPYGSRRMPFLHSLDIRLGKQFSFGNTKLDLFVDLFNAINANTATSIYNVWGSSNFGVVDAIQDGRLAQFGARFQF